MINLLPTDLRDSQRYAHANTLLLRWVVAGLLAVAGLGIIGGLGILYMNQTNQALDVQVKDLNASLANQELGKIKSETEDISSSIKLAVTVLSKEVLFSQLLGKLGSVTPEKASLTDLNISQEEKGVTITAQTADYDTATQLQVNLTKGKEQLFQKADIVSIDCNKSESSSENSDQNNSGTKNKYPCTVIIRALFVEDNPYLFINQDKKKS